MAENAIHFFTDQLLIDAVNNEYPFGFVSGKESTQFNLTSIHKSKNPNSDVCYAYATIDGQLFFQEDEKNNHLINVALKPKKQHILDGYTIKYFIYRGIKKDSLINGNSIISNSSSPQKEIDLLTKIWKAQKKLNQLNGSSSTPSKDIIGLGFTSNSTGGFENAPTDYIESFFYKNNIDFHTWDVKLGETIGIFSNDNIGFEIVVGNYLPTIKDLRQSQTLISVSDYNTLVDNASKFVNRVEREAVLNYIDPCAFFGLYFNFKVKTVHGNKKGRELVEMLQQIYVNSNLLYLDIRDRHNQSYSYYFNNFKQISVNIGSQNVYNGESHTNYWPLLILDTNSIDQSNLNTKGTSLTLQFNEVGVPSIMFHLAQGFYKNDYPKPRKKLIEITTDTSSNTSTANLMLHTCDVSGTLKLAPSLIKSRFIIKVADSHPPDEFELNQEIYFDNLFRLNDVFDFDKKEPKFPLRKTYAKTCYWHILDEDVYIDEVGGVAGGYMAKIGYAADNEAFYFFGYSTGEELRNSAKNPDILSGEANVSDFVNDILRQKFDVFSVLKEEISDINVGILTGTRDNLLKGDIVSNKKLTTSNNYVFYLVISKNNFNLFLNKLNLFYTETARLFLQNNSPSNVDYTKRSLGINGHNNTPNKQKEQEVLPAVNFLKPEPAFVLASYRERALYDEESSEKLTQDSLSKDFWINELKNKQRLGKPMLGHQDSLAYGRSDGGWRAEDFNLTSSPFLVAKNSLNQIVIHKSDIQRVFSNNKKVNSYPKIFGWDIGRLEWKNIPPNIQGDQLVNYLSNPINSNNNDLINNIKISNLINWIKIVHRSGGLNSLSWHCASPLAAINSNDFAPYKFEKGRDEAAIKSVLVAPKSVNDPNVLNLYNTRRSVYLNWINRLKAFLKCLVDDNNNPIPIIFRPFHEVTKFGAFFWWNHTNSNSQLESNANDYKRLWTDLRFHLREFNNIIYNFSINDFFLNDNWDAIDQKILNCFPEDHEYDILGLDAYQRLFETNAETLHPIIGNYYKRNPDNFNNFSSYSRAEFIKRMNVSSNIIKNYAENLSKIVALSEFGADYMNFNPKWFSDNAAFSFLDSHRDRNGLMKKTSFYSFVMLWRNPCQKNLPPISADLTEFYSPFIPLESLDQNTFKLINDDFINTANNFTLIRY